MKRGDKIMFSVFMVMIVFLTLSHLMRKAGEPHNARAVILQNGNVIKEIELSSIPEGKEEKIRIEYNGGFNVLTVKRNRIAVTEASCPDRDCVRTGELTRNGDSAVCLPNRLSVRFKSSHLREQVDGVTW